MLIQFSPKFGPTPRPMTNAWPMWEPKLRTPGIAWSSFAEAVEIRTSSACDVPGLVTQCIRKSRSLKFGQQLLAEAGHDDEPGRDDQAGHGERRGSACGRSAGAAARSRPGANATSGDSRAPQRAPGRTG